MTKRNITSFLLFALLLAVCAAQQPSLLPSLTFVNTGRTLASANSTLSARLSIVAVPSNTPPILIPTETLLRDDIVASLTAQSKVTPLPPGEVASLTAQSIASEPYENASQTAQSYTSATVASANLTVESVGLTAQIITTATYGYFETQEVLGRQANDDAQGGSKTQESDFPINCTEKIGFFSLSPDGNWVAFTCGDHAVDRTLNVLNHAGKQWILPYRDYLPKDELIDVIPSSFLGPVHWLDGDYFYFTPGFAGDYGGTCLFFAGNTALYRLDLKDGKVAAVLSPTFNGGYNRFITFAFSTRGYKLAYIQDNGLVILDLITGEQTKVDVHESSAGNLIWSPDGKELAYGTCQPNQDGSTEAYSSVRIYSLDAHSSTTILEADNYFYDSRSFFVESTRDGDWYLEIYDFRYRSYFYYLWSSKTLVTPVFYSTVTPTPAP